MQIYFLCPNSFETWDWRSPDYPGIGGSETAVVELSRRLASRGHNVTVYAPVKKDTVDDPAGVSWNTCDAASTDQPGLWIVCRSPKTVDLFQPNSNQEVWLQCQDVYYSEATGGGEITEERANKFSKILALCPTHADYLAVSYPFLANVAISSNGIKTDAMNKLAPVERDPHRLIWTSSPDRGLENLLSIFARAREYEPSLNLHVFYGWNNIDKVIAKDKSNPWAKLKERIARLPQDNVFWHGRTGQTELWQEYLRASLWVYPTTFTETSCISCMEAQALGAIPICPPLWALKHNVRYGISLQGVADDPLEQCRYVGAILRLVRNQDLCRQIRREMMPWALEHFDWEKIVDQYERWM